MSQQVALHDVVATLRELVSLPSVNPMGRDVSGDIYLEYRVTQYLETYFQRLGVPYVVQEVAPKRANIIARFEGKATAGAEPAILMFEAHQDTVPVEGMTIPPWGAELRDGKIFGRGACDVKGGMAAMLTAFARLVSNPSAQHPTVVIACTVDEEFAAVRGVGELHRLWEADEKFLPRAPDVAIVAEPTLLDIVVAHKGALRWRCHTRGLAAHSSQPDAGENAIYTMAQVLSALQQYAKEVPALTSHRLLGNPSLSVGTITGGVSVNTVADHCVIEIDRRLLPGDDAQQAFEHAASYVASALGPLAAKISHDAPFLTSAALDDSQNRPLAEQLSRYVRQHGGKGELIGVNFGTDAPAIARHQVPTVVFGPGSIKQAHTADEWIAVDQLLAATDILEQFARNWSGSSV